MIKLKQLIEAVDPDMELAVDELREKLISIYGDAIESLFFHVSASQPDVLHLDHIRIAKHARRQGIGSDIMNQLKQFADEHKLIITLSPEAEPRYKAKLDKFYRGHGFVHNRGRKKDYRLSSFYGPNMIRRPMTEEGEDIDEYELEDLQGVDAIVQYLQAHGKEPKIIELADDKYIIWDDNIVDPEYPNVKEKNDWIYSMEGMRLITRLKDKMEDQFNQRFWNHPEALFHATPRQNVDAIRKEGLKAMHISRGFSNKHIRAAVFTSTEPDWITHSYGPVVATIRTDLMKKDGFTPYVTKEPNHTEADATNFIAQKIGAWDDDRVDGNPRSEGTTDDTVIIYASIPPKYLEITE